MRCPNCGNENPDDYTFCDECGARLKPQEGETDAAVAGAGVASAPADSGQAGMAQMASAAPDGPAAGPGEMGAPAEPVPGGGVCPNCGAATVPGEAFCSECGAELSTGDTSAAAGAAEAPTPIMEPYMGAGAAPAPVVSAEQAPPDTEMPVTEDTMLPATQGAQADAMAAPPAQPSMPGVTPVGEAEEGLAVGAPAMTGIPTDQGAPYMPGMAADSGTAAWANEALRQLEDAQQSMARGDWVAYGQHMSSLKAFLESVAGGAPAMEIAPAVATTGPSAYELPAGMPAPATEPPPTPLDSAAPAATSEPAAEAGMLGAAAAPGAYPPPGQAMARLVVISTGAELPLPQQEEITVGREDPSSGIFPDIDLTPYGGEDGGVSRRHARLLHVGNDYFVEDLQSTNYTKLDGQRLPARVREKLEDGARLDFGRIAVIFRKS